MQNGKRWVATYELSSVKISHQSDRPDLTLKGRDGRWFGADLRELQDEPWIWDLAYNGILHSVVDGAAEADAHTRLQLRLPPGPDVDPDLR